MKKINFCKATTIILIINVILSIVLFFVVPDNIAIQWVGTTPSNAVDSYYIFLVPILSVLFAFAGKPIFTMFLFRLWNRTNEHLRVFRSAKSELRLPWGCGNCVRCEMP